MCLGHSTPFSGQGFGLIYIHTYVRTIHKLHTHTHTHTHTQETPRSLTKGGCVCVHTHPNTHTHTHTQETAASVDALLKGCEEVLVPILKSTLYVLVPDLESTLYVLVPILKSTLYVCVLTSYSQNVGGKNSQKYSMLTIS
jgi:hypothetical protein